MPKGVYSIAGRRKAWTVEDEWDVADGIAKGQTVAQIAKRLGRSENSVKVYCTRNLKCLELRPLTCRKVAAALGLGCSKIARRWIEQGWLVGRRATLGAGKARQWHVTEDALLAFMANSAHWHRWDVERVSERAMREWAAEVRRERYWTQAEVARRFNVVTGTVGSWLDKGVLPYVDTGSHRMVAESALTGFVVPSDRPRAGYKQRRFTADEDARLLTLRDGGASWPEIAYQLRRAMGSCCGRYDRLTRARIAAQAA